MDTNQLVVKMMFDRWYSFINKFNTFLDSVSDEMLQQEIAPGRNRGIYILGHLIAVHDDMFSLLGLGEKLYPELHEPFLAQPDRATADIPSAGNLRAFWKNQTEVLNKKMESLTAEEWFGKHSAVSAEDFAKEPNRNKLNILITRTNHLSYHMGQLALIKQIF